MKIVFIVLGVIIAVGIIVYNVELSNEGLTKGGFYLSLLGLIISTGGTVLSGLSFVNAKAAKEAANEAREQLSKGNQNIELAKLHKQGTKVREKTQQLLDKSCENHEEILAEIVRFSLEAEDMSSFIDGIGFSTIPSLIRTQVDDYRKGMENPGISNRQSTITSSIIEYITRILKITNDQISKNLK